MTVPINSSFWNRENVLQCRSSVLSALSSEILGKGHRLRFQAHGWSMTPFVRDGDVLEVMPASGMELQPGDVVFRRTSTGGMVAHRLITRRRCDGQEILFTKGDAARRLDAPVSAEDIVGKVVAIERDGKRVDLEAFPARWLNRLQGWISYAETVIWQWGRQLKRRLMKDKPSPLTPIAMRVLRLPSRMCAVLQNMAMR